MGLHLEMEKIRTEWQCISHTGQDLTDFDKTHNTFLCGMCLYDHSDCDLVRLVGLQSDLKKNKVVNEKCILKAKEVYQQGAAELELMRTKGKERIKMFIDKLQKLIEDMTAGLRKYNETVELDINKAIEQISSLPDKCDQNVLLISKIINCRFLPKGDIKTSAISDFCLHFDEFLKKLKEPQEQLKADMQDISNSFEKFEQKLQVFSSPLQKFKESIWVEVFFKDNNGAFQLITNFTKEKSKTSLTPEECFELSKIIISTYKLTVVPTIDDINEEFAKLDVLSSGDLPPETILELIKKVIEKLSKKAGVEILPSTYLTGPSASAEAVQELLNLNI
eukprot:TRINITY_DN2743_c0_g4_i1.p1 TRINITY_DN2743_c0_g4~~TRINITY_DN2743_c0_g4_i1.p1  ORF type:complete len:348 (+),score=84.43 TRINITY_DN2743_c0_g4_i1:42-1046(+)